MREILFRGRDKHTGKFVYGHYYTTPYAGKNGEVNTIHFISDIHSYGSHMVDPDTVGQFTGITDADGKKVFEGDIIRVFGETYACRWDDGNCEFGVSNKRESFGIAYVYCPLMEVIGNIHDNPELVEVSK